MRVLKFVTLFLALAAVTGCSHRRAQPHPVAASFCECSTCRHDQERLIREGAVPADHFENRAVSQSSQAVENEALPTPAQTNDFSPEYASQPATTSRTVSPFSSGNPIEMGDAAPGMPVIDQIEVDRTPFEPSNTVNDLQLDLPSSNQIRPLDDVPTETIPDGAFKPFNREVFKVKEKIDNVMPLDQQPSILIDKVSKSQQPDLSTFVPTQDLQLQLPKLNEPESNDFKLPDASDSEALSLEQPQTENIVPHFSQVEPAAELTLPAPEETTPAKTFSPVPKPIRQTETVVQGELYEDPIVLYARQRRNMMAAAAVQNPGPVKPVSAQKPVEHQSIVQDSEYDPIYGLPLSNNVDFNSLPAIQQPAAQQPPAVAAPANQAKHLHVHIHHDYTHAPAGQVRQIDQSGQQSSNVQVVYRDEDGRVIMAPPTPTSSVRSTEPNGDQRTYYVPPEPILRLKATSPISRQRSHPSVATIQMRDTIIHGGTHLLATPDYQARPVLTEHGLPGINYQQLREAFNTSPTDNPLR